MGRGVDTHLFTPARRNRSGSKFRIGYVGRLTPEKNVRFLAELGRGLERAGKKNFEFHIVGQGRERDWLQANVPNAILPGVLLGEELAEAYANMDLFAFPSTTDTFGNVVLEALASGVPCVVTATGGPKFLVQPAVTGYVAADNASFIRCVSSLMTNLDAHHAMREAARHYAFGWSWDHVFQMVFRAYDACLPSRKANSKASARDRMCLSA
jgi:glycosyltransferase involved in cell wall biosynthesis